MQRAHPLILAVIDTLASNWRWHLLALLVEHCPAVLPLSRS
jgi:hypothetical protein